VATLNWATRSAGTRPPVLDAIQPEADGTLGGAAVDVIDEYGLDLLSQGLYRSKTNRVLPDLGFMRLATLLGSTR
jgi:hypothetical protein